jgi:hypothetical protein
MYYDHRTENIIAVSRARDGGKFREMMVAFLLESKEEITLVTVHPLKPRQKANRIASGRWIPYEREKE